MSTQLDETAQCKTFKCPDHVNNVWTKLQTFYNDKYFDDIVLIAENDQTRFNAHKWILSASSSYFLTILRKNRKKQYRKARSEEMRLKDIDGIVLESILGFIYTASIELHSETVRRVLRAAELFQMDSLIAACRDFMGDQLTVWNCLSVLSLAEEQGYTDLHKEASVFAYTNFDEICSGYEFLQLNYDQLKKFIFGADICAEKVFLSMVVWIDYDRQSRDQYLFELLSNVRFDLLTPKFIIDNRHSICQTIECYELICSWLQWHLSPETRPEVSSCRKHTKLGFVGEDLAIRTLDPESDWPFWILNHDLKGITRETAKNKSVIAINEKLITVGGEFLGEASNNVECFDLPSKVMSSLPPMSLARSLAGVAELNGNLYVIGGFGYGKWLDSVEMYDFSIGSWQEVAPLTLPYTNIKVAVVDGLIYAVGSDCRSMDCFNPITMKWNRKSFNVEKSSDFGIAGVGGKLFVVGGCYNGNDTFTVECYERETNCWTVVTHCDIRRSSVECVVLNDKLIVCEDSKSMWMLTNYVKEYDPKTNEWKLLDSMLHKGPKVGLITM